MAARFNVLSLAGALSSLRVSEPARPRRRRPSSATRRWSSGTPAAIYTESVLVDMSKGGTIVSACSGALIARASSSRRVTASTASTDGA